MKVLYVVDDRPLSPNGPGGSGTVFLSNLSLLNGAGAELSLCLVRDPAHPLGFEDWKRVHSDDWKRIQSWCSEVHYVELTIPQTRDDWFRRKLKALVDPDSFIYPFLNEENISRLSRVIESVKPDLIWAAALRPGLLSTRKITDVPVIYEHHDWFWRIRKYRDGKSRYGIRDRALWHLRKQVEDRLVRRVAGCVTNSVTEGGDLRRLRVKNVARYPLTWPTYNSELPNSAPVPVRVIHLGNLHTTASSIGLERFLEIAWPLVLEQSEVPPELWIVGDMTSVSESLRKRLQDIRATCTGYVPDLGTILRPYDIHVIPWEYDTGIRTRALACLHYAQVLLGTCASVACHDGFSSGENCILVDNLEEMGRCIIKLLNNHELRLRLGKAGNRLLTERFSPAVVQPVFNNWFDSLSYKLTRDAKA